jgi:hypothetical protein
MTDPQDTDAYWNAIAWAMFCKAHPVEAFAHDPERFWAYVQTTGTNVTRERMVELLREADVNPGLVRGFTG